MLREIRTDTQAEHRRFWEGAALWAASASPADEQPVLLLEEAQTRVRVPGGVDAEGRGDCWRFLLFPAVSALRSHPAAEPYAELAARAAAELDASASVSIEIEKDVRRSHLLGEEEEARARLRRILLAYAARNPAVGYCQGMNVLGSVLLHVLDDEAEAFWGLCVLVEQTMRGYHDGDMRQLRIDLRVLSSWLAERCPAVSQALVRLGVDTGFLCTQWLVTAFADSLQLPAALRVWDVLLSLVGEGELAVRAVLGVSAVLLASLEREICGAADCSVVMHLVGDAVKAIGGDEGILQAAFSGLHCFTAEDLEAIRTLHLEDVEDEITGMQARLEVEQLQDSTHFTSDDIEEMRRQYLFLQQQQGRSEDDGLTADTFSQLLDAAVPGWTERCSVSAAECFAVFDVDDSGSISFAELVSGMSNLLRGTADERLGLTFRLYDRDGSGYLEEGEVVAMVKGMYRARVGASREGLGRALSRRFSSAPALGAPEEAEPSDEAAVEAYVSRLFSHFDDGDGRLSFPEWQQAVTTDPFLAQCFQRSAMVPVASSADATQLLSPPAFAHSRECSQCQLPFSTITRRVTKHHCRHCGQSFCQSCSCFKMEIQQFRIHDPVRVCSACFDFLKGEPAPGEELSGYLSKRGNSFPYSWRLRWFVLLRTGPAPEERTAYYYQSHSQFKKGAAALGTVELGAFQLEFDDQVPESGSRFPFYVITQRRRWELAASSHLDLMRWLKALDPSYSFSVKLARRRVSAQPSPSSSPASSTCIVEETESEVSSEEAPSAPSRRKSGFHHLRNLSFGSSLSSVSEPEEAPDAAAAEATPPKPPRRRTSKIGALFSKQSSLG